MKILLAVDGSPFTKKMLAYLAAHEELITAGRHEYTALTVQPSLPPRARAALSKDMVDEYYAEESAKVLDPVTKFLAQSGITVHTRAEIGPAGTTIAKIAEDDKFDLIIMGTHGHGSLGKLVMGSVSTQVLANCSVPVMLIR
ncbi:universal stress protein [Comamonas aquatica]|jgi:nucleotide-binding universal stress UspA family protein|uniref:Universal stress protein UspA n=1 Tax=Comamonas aquatica DA1877 TaxID=1457173 RepID=A0A014MTS4_9BURK|nr:universal stress protein [Comamonas aquatica]ANY61008.1 universal stress protein UspA [Comamonas aquatica]EXU81459.1 universal stress protein UspA [Comamonas aquatica DA1877]MDH1379804.1 universal stress protein [Comamonas aquatica]MDH1639831.1 universal stress protein [Comamonas aquatica]MDH1812944.1 universal stress protein [Comamonas aquatica]